MIKTHASLFSGIGAAEIAADWMGWQNAVTDEELAELKKYEAEGCVLLVKGGNRFDVDDYDDIKDNDQ